MQLELVCALHTHAFSLALTHWLLVLDWLCLHSWHNMEDCLKLRMHPQHAHVFDYMSTNVHMELGCNDIDLISLITLSAQLPVSVPAAEQRYPQLDCLFAVCSQQPILCSATVSGRQLLSPDMRIQQQQQCCRCDRRKPAICSELAYCLHLHCT